MYTGAGAARLLRVAPATLHYWLEGGIRSGRTYKPVIRGPAPAPACVRWADESAARTTSRDVVAVALTRAAGAACVVPLPGVVLGAAAADVTIRLAALRSPTPRLTAAARRAA